jgi:hypothetical protein
MKLALDITSAAFAVIAASLWFSSAMIRTPKHFPIASITPAVPSHLAIGGMQSGTARSDNLEGLGAALTKQCRLSALAATSAAVAAICQAVAIISAAAGCQG